MIYFIYVARDPESEPWYYHVQMSATEAKELTTFLEDYVQRGFIYEFAITRPEQSAISATRFKRRFKDDLLPAPGVKRWVPFPEDR